jgi:hypothetical protein
MKYIGKKLETEVVIDNRYKTDLLKAVTLLDDTIAWLDNNEGNSQTEEEQNEVIKAVALLTDFINERL